MNDPKQNWQAIQNRIREYEITYHRKPHSVTLLVVTKGQPVEQLERLFNLGQTAFGESYLQEALPKIAALSAKKIEWHFIGPIQSNKTKKIAECFQWVHSVDDKRILKRLSDARPVDLPALNICLQVKLSKEATKSGVDSAELTDLADYAMTLPRLKLRGLMTIPAPETAFVDQCIPFKQLHALLSQLNENNRGLDTLSMGMSDDMEAAIAEGATLVRIGTAIFSS